MSLSINELRLTFLWTETFVPPLSDNTSASPIGILGSAARYGDHFDQAQRGQSPLDLEPPWPKPEGQRFWHYYLGQRSPGDVTGSQAWKALVPLRWRTPPLALTPVTPVRLIQEGYVYPHGLAYAVTFWLIGARTLEEAVEAALDIRLDSSVAQSDETNAPPAPMSVIAQRALDELRRRALGDGAVAGFRNLDPFTIATFLRADGANPAAPVIDGGDVHHALEALATWRRSWKHDAPPPLAKHRLATKGASDARVVYAHGRGRVVWAPALFQRFTKRVHSLACYHRNLLFTSMQVESLLGLAEVTLNQIHQKQPIAAAQSDYARFAAGILGRIYGGESSTYRSASAKAQISDRNVKKSVNELRVHCRMKVLTEESNDGA